MALFFMFSAVKIMVKIRGKCSIFNGFRRFCAEGRTLRKKTVRSAGWRR